MENKDSRESVSDLPTTAPVEEQKSVARDSQQQHSPTQSQSAVRRMSAANAIAQGQLTHELMCKYIESLEKLEEMLRLNTALVKRRNQYIKLLQAATMEEAQNRSDSYYYTRFLKEKDCKITLKREEALERSHTASRTADAFAKQVNQLCRELADVKFDIAVSFSNIAAQRLEVKRWWQTLPRDDDAVSEHETFLARVSETFGSPIVRRSPLVSIGTLSASVPDSSDEPARSSIASSSSSGFTGLDSDCETPRTQRSHESSSSHQTSGTRATQASPRVRRSSISLGVLLDLEKDQKNRFSVDSTDQIATRTEMENGTFEMHVLKVLRAVAPIPETSTVADLTVPSPPRQDNVSTPRLPPLCPRPRTSSSVASSIQAECQEPTPVQVAPPMPTIPSPRIYSPCVFRPIPPLRLDLLPKDGEVKTT